MITLELPYLLSVIQHFQSHHDLQTFLLINRKCEQTIYALKKNPPFENERSMIWFFNHFQVDTFHMTCMDWIDINLLETIQRIQFPEFFYGYFHKIITKEKIKQLVHKITALRLRKHDGEEKEKKIVNELNRIYIMNAIQFQCLRYIEGDLLLIVSFFEKYTTYGKEQFILMPKKIVIDSFDGEEIDLKKQQIDHLNQLNQLFPINQDIDCIIILKEQCLKHEVINQFKRFTFWCRRLNGNTTSFHNQQGIVSNGSLTFSKYFPSNEFDSLINKCHADEIIFEHLKKSKIDNLILPLFIKKIMLYETELQQQWIWKISFQYIEELTLQFVNKITFQMNMKNMKHIKLIHCENIKFKNCEIDSLQSIHCCKSLTISFEGKEIYQIMTMKILDCADVFINCLEIISLIEIVTSRRITFIQSSWNDSNISIENSQSINFGNKIIPIELQSYSMKQYNSFINTFLMYSSKQLIIHSNKNTYQFHRFISLTPYVEVINNCLIHHSKKYDKQDGYYILIMKKFASFDDYQQKQQVHDKDGNECELETIRYIEFTIPCPNCISIGCFDENVYDYSNNQHFGWSKYSIGYHSDDGHVYNESWFQNTEHLLPFGNKTNDEESQIVGIGYHILKEEIFFTLNGKFLKSFKKYWRTIGIGLVMEECEDISINCGEKSFVFDWNLL